VGGARAIGRPWRGAGLGILALGCVLAASQVSAAPQGGPWWEAFEAGGLQGSEVQLSPQRPRDLGRYRLPAFDPLWDDWRRLAPAAERAAEGALGARTLAELARCGTAFLTTQSAGWPRAKRRGRPPAPARLRGRGPAALVSAIEALGRLDTAELSALRRSCAEVPEQVALIAAELLSAVPAAVAARERALRPVGIPPKELFWPALNLGLSGKRSPGADALLNKLDRRALLEGAEPLAAALDAAGARLQGIAELRTATFAFSWETPLGWIVLSGAGDQHHVNRTHLLLLDTSGDDQYDAGGGNCHGEHPVSLLLDLAGDDRYFSVGSGDFGVGLLGYGLHLDLAGDDRYRGEDISQGCGVAGVGLLLDRAGRDHYQARKHSQGAGTLGLGVLADFRGDDRWDARDQSQGYGGVLGAGVLADRSGDDRYVLDDEEITRPAAQTKDHNTSLGQGAGFGYRAHRFAGGLGLLADAKGDDRYSCGVFGQGTAYWYALGFLVDREGNDRYGGVWYVQGSAAHYAAAVLVDGAGDDQYRALLHQAQGTGHDYSLGVLLEKSGDDDYRARGSAQGGGLWNGIGALADLSGKDVYRSGGRGLGTVGAARPEHTCFGVFNDRGGQSEFPRGHAKPGLRWRKPGKAEGHLGMGSDSSN
jgi:hypothetical protein